MNALTRILLVFAIVVVALIGLGFGLCGVVGIVVGLLDAKNVGAALSVLPWAIAGLGIAAGAVILIRTTLWRALRRRDKE